VGSLSAEAPAELVLVGGGHAHVQVLRRFMMRPDSAVHLTVVLDRPEAVYSGMVPGLVAGDYTLPELEIDVLPLARRARAGVILSPALRIDPGARCIELEGRPPIRYDVASIDVGSTVLGQDVPGVRELAIATRPIRSFTGRIERILARARTNGGELGRIVVVGTGAAGVELAFTLEARLRAEGLHGAITLLGDAPALLPGAARSVSEAALAETRRRGISVRAAGRVTRVEKDALRLEGGEELPCDLAIWATGAAPVALLDASPLPKDAAGFVRVSETLQVEGCEALFAVGDCASLAAHPWVPRAGVYAVREGPFLEHNLRAALAGRALRRYRPQRDFLSLLNLGDRRALGAKWGRVVSGRSVWRLKDWIDRRFVRRFQVLEPDGALAPAFPDPAAMGMEEMPCGGCAAKLGAPALSRALARVGAPPSDDSVLLGLGALDDAAALRTPSGDVLLATVDGFRAFTDDPWLVGRVAAINAVSDVLAKGGRARHALALVTLPEGPEKRAEELLFQVLAGVRAALDPLGVTLVGGHTTTGPELFVGLSVTGELSAGATPLPLAGLRTGDRLILTKPLGTGVLLAADMQGRAPGAWVQRAHASLLADNVAAARVALDHGASASTDVSGFGLARHQGEMLRASEASAILQLASIPALEGALPLLAAGVRSTFHEQNASLRSGIHLASPVPDHAALELLFDPQTSGGLLFGVPAAAESSALTALGAGAAAIGTVTPPRGDAAIFSVEA
jgi:selenide,water dikinase